MEPKEKISTVPWATAHIPPPWRWKGAHGMGRDGDGWDKDTPASSGKKEREQDVGIEKFQAQGRLCVSFIHLFLEGFETVLNKTVK